MVGKRKSFQGVCNIIRFNWHFYVLVLILVVLLTFLIPSIWIKFSIFAYIAAMGIFSVTLISLLVSYYVYDYSKLYALKWLGDLDHKKVVTIHAGFDETSTIIEEKFKHIDLTICDFYDPKKHTEVSIKRARKAYQPHPDTIEISTTKLPFKNNAFDVAILILSAHEIRDKEERIQFFKEVKRVTRAEGKVFVTEHLRDRYNFLAYTIGFLHFYSRKVWKETFRKAQLSIQDEIQSTVFITTFILEHDRN